MRKKGSAWQQELHDSVQNKVSRCIASQQQITQSSLTQPEWMTGKRYLACKRQSWLVEHAHSVNLIIFGDQSLHELRKRTYNGKRRQQVGPQTVSLIYTDMNILLKHDTSYCNILAWSFFGTLRSPASEAVCQSGITESCDIWNQDLEQLLWHIRILNARK